MGQVGSKVLIFLWRFPISICRGLQWQTLGRAKAALAEDVGATRSPVEAKRPRGRPRKTNTNTATASKATKETKAPTTRKSRRKSSVEIKVEEPELEEEIKVVAFKSEEETVVKQEEGQVEAERCVSSIAQNLHMNTCMICPHSHTIASAILQSRGNDAGN